MKRLVSLVIALLSFSRTVAVAGAEVEIEPAMPVLRMYVAAVAANDCSLVWRLTSSEAKSHGEAPEQYRELVCRIIARMQATHVQEQLAEPIAHLTDGPRHAVFVPSKRVSRAFGVAPVTELMYIVYSNDDGVTWEVLDLGCVDQRWVRAVFPAYRGDPPLPADRARALEFLP